MLKLLLVSRFFPDEEDKGHHPTPRRRSDREPEPGRRGDALCHAADTAQRENARFDCEGVVDPSLELRLRLREAWPIPAGESHRLWIWTFFSVCPGVA